MPKLSGSNIVNNSFHVDNDKVESGIGHDVIICRDLMVQLGLTANFKCQVLQWYGATVHMKEPINLLGQFDLTKREMFEVVMQNSEPAPTRETTEKMVKILDSTYAKADLKQVTNDATHMNSD